ncbi:hypothetical protein CRUP_016764 [Coryphaenoides rupestris]|nr:hypothetical protein CRUP_016764 [Coryphaenoides rupestris]
MEIAVVAGFAAFLGKYLEQQFNLTTSSANQLLASDMDKGLGVQRPCVPDPLSPDSLSPDSLTPDTLTP